MNWNPYKLIPLAAAAVLPAFFSGQGFAAGQGSVSFLVTADVFTQGSGPAITESARYRASVSVGQRSLSSDPASGGIYTLESGYQAATGDSSAPPADPYNEWAAGYGLFGPDASPDADYDGDGFTNWSEYIADTDPTQDDSFFHLVSVTRDGNQATVSFTGSANRVYELWFTTDLTETSGWERVQGPRFGIGGADSMNHIEETGSPAGFYRVRVSLP